jgi:hypothetical protein
MTFWILVFACVNGAQGCTYSAGRTLYLSYEGSYVTAEACQKDANELAARYDDPDIYARCLKAGPPEAK